MPKTFIAGPSESGSDIAERFAEEIAHGEPPMAAAVVELFREIRLGDVDQLGDLYVVWGEDLDALDDDATWPAWARVYVDKVEQYRAEPQSEEQ